MKKISLILCCGLALVLFGCSSAKKAELKAGGDTEAAVAEVAALMQEALRNQADLLAVKEYMEGAKVFKRAEQALSNGYEKDMILNYASIAKAHFQEASLISGVRSANANRILHARKSALVAGLRNSDKLLATLDDVDDDLRDETDNFVVPLSPEDFSGFQKKYFSLEVKAVQFRELDGVRRAIRTSSNNDAGDLAPGSLRMAKLDLNEAENIIGQSPRNPDIHGDSVKKSAESSVFLLDVMDVILNAEGTPENIAIKIVNQNRQLGILSKNVGLLEKNLQTSQTNLATTKSNLSQTEGTLKSQEEALKAQEEALKISSTQIKFQKAMELAGDALSEDEALVYQQGNTLVFRLKKIKFASGNSAIPSESKPLLSKINDIIRPLGAEKVVVQGHTDSIGSAAINKKLSIERASSVAKYLASFGGGYRILFLGYGEAKPLESNETQEGRAINRRVDLVVTAKK